MPTIFSHAAIGFVAAKVAAEETTPNNRIMIASMALAVLPDADGLFFDVIPYGDPLGHRGFTHSLFFAAVIGLAAALLFSKSSWAPEHSFRFLAILFALVIASHGFLDAMTNGGLGIAFFAPFSNHRYFLPWRPIPVAPMSVNGLLNPRGLRVIGTEAALFGVFTLGAAIWSRKTKWRMALAGLCAVIGMTIWVFALAAT